MVEDDEFGIEIYDRETGAKMSASEVMIRLMAKSGRVQRAVQGGRGKTVRSGYGAHAQLWGTFSRPEYAKLLRGGLSRSATRVMGVLLDHVTHGNIVDGDWPMKLIAEEAGMSVGGVAAALSELSKLEVVRRVKKPGVSKPRFEFNPRFIWFGKQSELRDRLAEQNAEYEREEREFYAAKEAEDE